MTKKGIFQKNGWLNKNWFGSFLLIIIGTIFTWYGFSERTSGATSEKLINHEKQIQVLDTELNSHTNESDNQLKSINHNFELILNILYKNHFTDSIYKHNVDIMLKELSKNNKENSKLFEILFEQNKIRSYNYIYFKDTAKSLPN